MTSPLEFKPILEWRIRRLLERSYPDENVADILKQVALWYEHYGHEMPTMRVLRAAIELSDSDPERLHLPRESWQECVAALADRKWRLARERDKR